MKKVIYWILILSLLNFQASLVWAGQNYTYNPTSWEESVLGGAKPSYYNESYNIGLKEKVEALSLAKYAFKISLLSSRSEIERALNCVSSQPQKKFGLFVFDSERPMFDAITSCDEYILKISNEVKSKFGQMKVYLSLIVSANEAGFGYKVNPNYDSSIYYFMDPKPKHLFSGLTNVSELTRAEVAKAVSLYQKHYDRAVRSWAGAYGYDYSKPETYSPAKLSASHKKALNLTIRREWDKAQAEFKREYFNLLSEAPYLGYIPNYFSDSWNNIDRAILENAFLQIEKNNCKIIVEHLASNDLKKWYSSVNKSWKLTGSGNSIYSLNGNLTQDLCEADFYSEKRQDLLNQVYESSPEFAKLLSRTLKYETVKKVNGADLESTMASILSNGFESKSGHQIESESLAESLSIMKEILSGDSETESDMNSIYNQVKSETDLNLSVIELNKEFKRLKKYAWYLPVLERFSSQEYGQKYKEILISLNEEIGKEEILSDLKKVGLIIAAMVGCNFVGYLPGLGKMTSPLAKALACDVIIGLSGDVYFYNLENNRYTERYIKHFMGMISSEEALVSLQQLQDSELSIYIENATFWFSVGITIKGLRKVMKNRKLLFNTEKTNTEKRSNYENQW